MSNRPKNSGSARSNGFPAGPLRDPAPRACLTATATVASDQPAIVDFAHERTRTASGEQEAAIALYYAVRDGLRYDPYGIDMSRDGLCADVTLAAGRGWCVSKAVLLAAACRARGIPARLGFADVRNHLSTERMRAFMQTDVFYWHGFTEMFLAGKWVKATPAFNIELCEKFGLLPLDFDATADSIYHPFDAGGNKHMEYVHERGSYLDVPLEEMMNTFRARYPRMSDGSALRDHSFGTDIDRDLLVDP